MPPNARRADFEHSPFLVFYEITRACDLACAHCRACAQPRRHPRELTPQQARALVDDLLRFEKPPLLVLTGGDPLKREDVYELTAYATGRGLRVAMTPSATPQVSPGAIEKLQAAGLRRLALSLDGARPETHDGFRRVRGSFDRTFEILADARAAGLSLQVNTTMTRRNLGELDALAEKLAGESILLWSVFFLVPVGRGLGESRIPPEAYEAVFEKLWHHAGRQPYGIKTTEAPHYRRFVLERLGDPQRDPRDHAGDTLQRAPLGVNDGKGVLFISHTGAVFPSGFMPIACGRFPDRSIPEIYQASPLMRRLRDPDGLRGKCGACEYRQVCGGSRARAYALTGDPLASEPDCIYQPAAKRAPRAAPASPRPIS